MIQGQPTWGRVSRHGVFPLSDTLDHVGPMTRRVEDAAAMLGAIAGHDDNDPTSLPGSAPDYLASLNAGVKGLRIASTKSTVRKVFQRRWYRPSGAGSTS